MDNENKNIGSKEVVKAAIMVSLTGDREEERILKAQFFNRVLRLLQLIMAENS